MKINFRKIATVIGSALLIGSTAGFAAAANFPAPFNSGSTSTVGIVYGSGAAGSDMSASTSISEYLDLQGGSTGAPTGDSVLIGKSSDHLNMANTWSVFTGNVDNNDLSTLLADGTYLAGDNDEFDYEQTIKLGTPQLTFFRDSDYEDEAGLSEKTPTAGFHISSNTWIMNYSLEFTSDPETDISSGDAEDIEGSDLPLMGRTYYVSDLKNGTSTSTWGKLTLLDSAESATVEEGGTVNLAGHEVGVSWMDADEVKFTVDGETVPASGKLMAGQTYKLDDGSYLGVRDISKLVVSGSTGQTTFSIGSGKLEITSGSEIKLNDDTIQGVKAWVHRGTNNGDAEKIDKIEVEWKTDEEAFLAPNLDMVMPGFGAVKFTMNDLIRPTEETVKVDYDSSDSIQLTVPMADGNIPFNILYANATGEIVGIGKSATERLATSGNATLNFFEKLDGTEYHEYFPVAYNTSTEAESFLLRAKVNYDSGDNRNETTIEKYDGSSWNAICEGYKAGDTCDSDMGDASFTITSIKYTSGGNESVLLTAGTNTNFNTVYTAGGLRIYLPYYNSTASQYGALGGVIADPTGGLAYTPSTANTAGYGWDTWYLWMYDEDKDDNIASGTLFNMTIDDNSDSELQVKHVNAGTSGGPASGKYSGGLEMDESNNYEGYIYDDVAPRIIHYTGGDQDYAEVYYPTGDSETYAEVYLTEAGSMTSSSGGMIFKDTESGWRSRDVILVGGSCINSATAEALNVADGTCEAAFTEKTGVGPGQFLIGAYDGFTSGKVALVVAGYHADDTVAGANYLIDPDNAIDTAVGTSEVYSVAGSETVA